ncbi:fimbrial biogenesis chaperone [Psychromonas sp. Urea-02u-13]|uniref:fimbrial biogenesis chaperone n=1 Tax=Psychromonas sp. Urea-02u-13 TaxID=2058326 RepID=UPI000C33A2B3|nr:fimbria/pilus periplasmic chaperone [Psychromonas sp. Urea-02u-13]PKG37798.1 hypothetical protein CXF74_16970 [Psychromonas sp. Urea-02u-13]
MKFNVFKNITLISFLCFLPVLAQATLLISPSKVMLEDRQRSQELILINTSNEPRTYRLSWVERTLSEQGAYISLTKEQAKEHTTSSNMIRFSPKQVQLKPGQRQIIKLAVRRPKGLEDGEYRSHLKLEAIPDKRVTDSDGTMSMKVKMLFTYILPVSVRKGSASSQVTINKIDLYKARDKDDKGQLNVFLANNSKYSTTGNLIAYLSDNNGKERVVARHHDFTFYPDLNVTQARLFWVDQLCKIKGCTGKLRVAYEGIKKETGKLLTEYQMQITPELFK